MLTTPANHLPRASALLCALAVTAWFVPGIAVVLQYNRAAIHAGQIWRIVTGHWTHWSGDQLFWDALMFGALAAMSEVADRRRFWCCLVSSALLIPLAVWTLAPSIALYRGLSGIDSALFAMVAATLRDRAGRRAHPQLWLGMALLGVLFVAKIAFEALTGATLFVSSGAGTMESVPLAHGVGAAVGAAWGACPRRDQPHRARGATLLPQTAQVQSRDGS